MSISETLKLVSDVHLNVASPEKSVLFPAIKSVSTDEMPFIEALIKNVLQTEKAFNALNPVYSSFITEFNFEGKRFRLRCQPKAANSTLFQLRLLSTERPDFDQLVKAQDVKTVMEDIELKKNGGFIIIGGTYGAGKTTLAYASISKRLQLYGGYCLGIEDLIENDAMDGFHGDNGGFYSSMDASVTGYSKAVVAAMRSFPITNGKPMMFIGEIRDPTSASEALRASLSGSLVIATMQAGDHVETLQRICALAEKEDPDARAILSRTIHAVINQNMDEARRVQASAQKMNTAAIRNMILKGEFQMLNGTFEQSRQARLGQSMAAQMSQRPG